MYTSLELPDTERVKVVDNFASRVMSSDFNKEQTRGIEIGEERQCRNSKKLDY